MPWFAAHLIAYFKVDEGDHGAVAVWENIVVVQARDTESAAKKAERKSRAGFGRLHGHARLGGEHAGAIVFAGVRKVMPIFGAGRSGPCHGEEVSYLEYTVPDMATVRALANGEKVQLVCNDVLYDRPEDP